MTRLPDQEYHPVVFKSICRIIRLYIIIARFTSDLIPPPCLGSARCNSKINLGEHILV